jgi:DNA-nicking Smr family endonuclease
MRKQIIIDGKIDLHGYTQDQAFDSLSRFLSDSCAEQKRLVIIVTGKGSPDKPGIIKTMLPRWLEYTALKRYVLSYETAPINFGGSGALLVKLKKS